LSATLLLAAAIAGNASTRKPLPSCVSLEGESATLRGEVPKAWDHMWPGEDIDDAVVLDPMESVYLLTGWHCEASMLLTVKSIR
jgi:hypothetical protein